MIASSATAGQLRSPSRPESSPSFIWASSSALALGVLGDDAAERLDVFQRPAHRTGSLTHLPSSEKTRTRAAESAIALSSASRSPASRR